MKQLHISVIARKDKNGNEVYYGGKNKHGKDIYGQIDLFGKSYAPTLASAVAKKLTIRTKKKHYAVPLPGKALKNKYSAQKVTVDGITFHSQKEARRYSELKLLEKAGEIAGLKCQVPYKFPINGENIRYPASKTGRKGREVVYIADFAYNVPGILSTWPTVEDTKGMMTKFSKLKIALMYACHGIEVKIT